jgi:hypothetical protein
MLRPKIKPNNNIILGKSQGKTIEADGKYSDVVLRTTGIVHRAPGIGIRGQGIKVKS